MIRWKLRTVLFLARVADRRCSPCSVLFCFVLALLRDTPEGNGASSRSSLPTEVYLFPGIWKMPSNVPMCCRSSSRQQRHVWLPPENWGIVRRAVSSRPHDLPPPPPHHPACLAFLLRPGAEEGRGERIRIHGELSPGSRPDYADGQGE